MAGNIRKARAIWGRLARILGREGADLKVTRSFYTAVTQQVLLFGAESWVLTKRMESDLGAFQGRVARRLTGQLPRRGRDRKWFYPPPGGGSQGGGGREVQDIGPPETEYGRAIHCDSADSRDLRGGGAAAGDTGLTAMVGAIRHRLEAGEGKGGNGGISSVTSRSNCRGDRDTRIRNGSGFRASPHEGVDHMQHRGGGVPGGQWVQRGRMERGRGLRQLEWTFKQST